jgi:hydrogenase/urease accessory protein HupE
MFDLRLLAIFSLSTLACVLLILSQPASGHEVRPAYLQITEVEVENDAPFFEVLWKQPAVSEGRLAIDPVFPKGCDLQDQAPPEITPSALIHRWVTDCDLREGLIHISGLSVTLTDVMVRFNSADGDTSNYLLRPENPTLDLSSSSVATLSYLVIGVEHLLFGIDHVLFVIGLVLFIREPWALLKTITAFTVAHSLTLGVSILGWVRLEQGPVEAVIALSILFLARELVQDESQRSRLTLGRPWLMAGLFGLLHGLGFAGALRDIGLPEDTLWLSLLLFNIGIELGQLMIIASLLAVSWVVGKFTNMAALTRVGAYGMGCMAAFWTIDRTLLLM